MPLAVSASQCPDLPAGMEYVSGGKTWAEASMNGAPFVKCAYLQDSANKVLGEGYYFELYECPNFSLVYRGIGLRRKLERKLNRIGFDLFTEKWYVVDKNKNDWTIWESNLFMGALPEDHEKGKGVKPVEEKTVRRIANGCIETWKITATADRINLVVRRHLSTKFAKKPVPTF